MQEVELKKKRKKCENLEHEVRKKHKRCKELVSVLVAYFKSIMGEEELSYCVPLLDSLPFILMRNHQCFCSFEHFWGLQPLRLELFI